MDANLLQEIANEAFNAIEKNTKLTFAHSSIIEAFDSFNNITTNYGFFYYNGGVYAHNYTPRELSKRFTEHSDPSKKIVKEERKSFNRSKTKEIINSENFDEFDEKRLAKDSNLWYYD